MFVPIRHVFKPQVEIRLRNDVSGWVNGDKTTRRKWHLPAGRVVAIDADKAREYVGKGYAEFVHEPRQPITDDERAELQAQVTRIDLGADDG